MIYEINNIALGVDDNASMLTLVNDLQARLERMENFTREKEGTEGDVFGSDVHGENTADLAKQIAELRNNVLGNTQREYDDYL